MRDVMMTVHHSEPDQAVCDADRLALNTARSRLERLAGEPGSLGRTAAFIAHEIGYFLRCADRDEKL